MAELSDVLVAHTQVIGYMIPYQDLVEAMKEVAFASRMLRYIATLTASRVNRMTSWLLTETSSEVYMRLDTSQPERTRDREEIVKRLQRMNAK